MQPFHLVTSSRFGRSELCLDNSCRCAASWFPNRHKSQPIFFLYFWGIWSAGGLRKHGISFSKIPGDDTFDVGNDETKQKTENQQQQKEEISCRDCEDSSWNKLDQWEKLLPCVMAAGSNTYLASRFARASLSLFLLYNNNNNTYIWDISLAILLARVMPCKVPYRHVLWTF